MPFWLRLLTILLIVGEPLGLAPHVAALVPTLGARGFAVAGLLFVQMLVAGLAVAAGLALWNRRAHALTLARAALVLSACSRLAPLLTARLPSNIPPDLRDAAAILIVAYYGGWIVYLARSRRVRAVFP